MLEQKDLAIKMSIDAVITARWCIQYSINITGTAEIYI